MVMINGYPTYPTMTKTNDNGNNSVNITVPTFLRQDVKNEVYLPELSASDLEDLKAVDPFLYYSIPSVREQALKLQDLSYESIRIGNSHPRQGPALRSDIVLPAQKIHRQSRISVEGYTGVVFFEMMADAEEINRDRGDRGDRDEYGIPNDPLMVLLSNHHEHK